MCICHSGENRWTRDENGNKIHLNLAYYGVEGERESVWFIDNVKKYHRTFSTIVNALIEAGFTIEKIIEDVDWFYKKADEACIYYTIHIDENLNIADFNPLVRNAYLKTVWRTIEVAKNFVE